MKKLMLFILVLLLANVAIGAEIVVNGSTSVSLYVVIQDSSGDPNTGVTITDLDFFWIEQGAAVESDTTITALGSTSAAYATGQAIHCQSGMYRVDFPDDCFNGGIGSQVQLIVDDVGTSNRTAFLTVLLSPQVDANTVAGGAPIPMVDMAQRVVDDMDANSDIVADTGELQTNQGNWVTATGFSTATELAQTDANVALVLADTGTDGVVLATDSVSADALNSDAVNEIWAKAFSDLGAGAPSVTATVFVALNTMYELMRNQTWVTATEITVYKDNASTVLMESTISDDGTTFKKGEYRAEN